MRIVRKENVYHICYYKSAVSVIENVVYAHDAQDIKETLEKGESEQPEQDKEALEKRLHQIEIIEALQRFAGKQEPKIDFEFVIISADQFNSGFRKPEFSKIDMIFPELN